MLHPDGRARSNGHDVAKDTTWLREVFDRHDLNGDGRLTLGEFIRLIWWLDGALTAEQCAAAFDRIDPHLRGAVDFEAFLSWWNRHETA